MISRSQLAWPASVSAARAFVVAAAPAVELRELQQPEPLAALIGAADVEQLVPTIPANDPAEPLDHSPPAPVSLADAAPRVEIYQQRPVEQFYPDEPPRFSVEDVDPFLSWCTTAKYWDLTIATNAPVKAKWQSARMAVTKRSLSQTELQTFLERVYDASGLSEINAGHEIDCSYEVKQGRDSSGDEIRFRFRVTAIGIQAAGGGRGIEITIRTLAMDIPTPEQLGVPPEIVLAVRELVNGVIFVTGPTGSGKSTLLASCIADAIRRPDANKKLVTHEKPIEFVFDHLASGSASVAQTEIGRHFRHGFARAIEVAMRRLPDWILNGETRDRETMEATLIAAATGHGVMTTNHAIGVANTMHRNLMLFPAAERDSIAFQLLDYLRLIITQRLLPAVDGSRVAAREWLVFDQEVRDRLSAMAVEMWPFELDRIVGQRGRSMRNSIEELFATGQISDQTRRTYLSELGADAAVQQPAVAVG